ncbi:MAG TPA: lipoprotein [Pedomonas sp.]|uniref:LPS translocon maturation chaperone LptM n=1 Tax=Pedomonas sp. TaxID=2976421 RepID=UPI002F404E94
MTRAVVLLVCALAVAACGKRGDLVPPPGKQPPAPIWEQQGPQPPVTPPTEPATPPAAPQAPSASPGN